MAYGKDGQDGHTDTTGRLDDSMDTSFIHLFIWRVHTKLQGKQGNYYTKQLESAVQYESMNSMELYKDKLVALYTQINLFPCKFSLYLASRMSFDLELNSSWAWF